MERYKYTEQIADDFVRILTLEPSSDDTAPVECTLSTVSRNNSGPYEALSYCCGPSTPSSLIVVDGMHFEVRENLASALRHLRLRDQKRLLWIDAICIHQASKVEKSEQVARMGETYSRCTKAVVWLGSAGGNSPLAMETIRMRALPIRGRSVADIYRSSEPLPVTVNGADAATYVSAVTDLLQRPYFTGLWVFQELCLAPEIVMICGHDKMDFIDFANFQLSLAACPNVQLGIFATEVEERLRWTSLLGALDFPLIILRNALQVTQKEVAGSSDMNKVRQDACVFLKILWSTRHRQCEYQQDRYYALRNIALDIDREVLAPNYDDTLETTYAKVTIATMKPSGNLNVMCFCRGPETSYTAGQQRPSWVPKFDLRLAEAAEQLLPRSLTNFTGREAYFTPTRDSKAQPKHSHDFSKLFVTGYNLGAIIDSASVQWAKGSIQQARAKVEAWVSSSADDEMTREIFWRTLIADCAADGSRARTTVEGAQFDGWWDAYSNPTQELDSTIRSTAARFDSAYYHYATRRSMFVTDTGLIGLGPQCLRHGDHVCLLAGAQTVFMLRPQGQDEYQMVGETYVHGNGIMDGQRWTELQDTGIEQAKFTLI